MTTDDVPVPMIPPMSDEEIDQLARAVVTNEVYLPLDPESLELSFGPLLALADGKLPPNLGAVWERYAKALPMGINGRPMFLSANYVALESLPALIERMREIAEFLYPEEMAKVRREAAGSPNGDQP